MPRLFKGGIIMSWKAHNTRRKAAKDFLKWRNRHRYEDDGRAIREHVFAIDRLINLHIERPLIARFLNGRTRG